ncbi:hypothetical protein EHO57_13980 [Leptospira langatensis]|uniref:Uncharacterized protein n=1 Tax=Leptospira langatensis TaxID=2484983 RepID=A0A5R2AT64_9LEPT|nr:hypothetical protein [Leptospira langatensis]TGJ99864.1 hypothetical protein EHO57_13980 [Leptospira langatensis]
MSTGYEGELNRQLEDFKYQNLAIKVYPDRDPKKNNAGKITPEWGCLIHPDEIRRVLMLGNENIVTTKGTQLEDFQLKNWIDMTVEAFQQAIEWDIYPRLWRHRPMPSEDGRFDISASGDIEDYAEWDDLYDYKSTQSNYFQLQLRQKPLAKVHKWTLAFPWVGGRGIDLMDNMIPKFRNGILRAVFVRVPGAALGQPTMGLQAWRTMQAGGSYPGAYQVDYTTGYDHANRVPRELKEVIIDLFLISLLSSYGEGIIGGISSYSTSVGVINESLNTTMSAENAFFGARIKQLNEKCKAWWKNNKHRYTQVKLRSLG